MEFIRMVLVAILCAAFCVSAQAQGHYQLKYSDLLQNCSFIHRDEFSLDSFQELIKAQLETRIEGDNACQSAFRALNSNLENMVSLINQDVTAQDARKLYGETYGDYLVSLQTELALLNPANPTDADRALVLQGQIDSLQQELLKNEYEVRLYDRTNSSTQLQQGQQKLMGHISTLLQNLAQMPPTCAEKIGGWQQIMPAITSVTSYIGLATGQWYLPAAAAGIQVGTEVAMLLKDGAAKKALSQLVAQKNNQIIACTYQAITHQACELKRASESVADTTRIEAIIANNYSQGSEGEYERFQRVQQMMPKIRNIIGKVGEMGSAITLDIDLLYGYFEAVRIRPFDIVIPVWGVASTAEVARWLTDMSNRGITIRSTDPQTMRPYSLKERYDDAVVNIENYKLRINNVTAIIREKRSFKDLRDELVLSSRNISNELAFADMFLTSFPLEKTEMPRPYIALFTATRLMLDKIRAFIDVEQMEGESYEDYLKRLEALGDQMFAEFSYGSVAQVTRQTALMVPGIASERFERPLRAIEAYYLNRDIERREDPRHNSYADYMVNRAVQVRVLNLYKNLSASGQAFRLEAFETTKQSFEKGFKPEISKMINQALTQDSPILGGTLKGKTAAHLCALFSDHLKRNDSWLYGRCKSAQRKLPLYQIMRSQHRPTEMTIDYRNPCFYSDYRREEYAQSLLFDRLLDYGFSKKR